MIKRAATTRGSMTLSHKPLGGAQLATTLNFDGCSSCYNNGVSYVLHARHKATGQRFTSYPDPISGAETNNWQVSQYLIDESQQLEDSLRRASD